MVLLLLCYLANLLTSHFGIKHFLEVFQYEEIINLKYKMKYKKFFK